MRSSRISFRTALLGAALTFTALSPAVAANASRVDLQRQRAIFGNYPSRATSDAAAKADPTYKMLYNFAGGASDGANPSTEVTIDDEGNIYGTAQFGGASSNGAIFKLAPDGTETLLHSFTGSDGSIPDGQLFLTSKGDLYGTTSSGGASSNGVIFRLTAKGKYKVLHDFDGTNDGTFARGRLVSDEQGNLYGTALFGGVNGDGTVFKYGSDGTFTVLHAFNGDDGLYPEHGLARDKAGNLYGVTAFGGASDEGTVFRLSSKGKLKTLYSFTGGSDGGFLYGTVTIDKNGNVYGSTVDGGSGANGTVFKLARDGTLTTLYNFSGGTDGGGPEGDMLIVGKNLYSVATSGGGTGNGVVYEVTSKGKEKEKVLHAFTGSDGGGYSAGLIENGGLLYGTTSSGGTAGNGVVFSVTKK